MLRSFCLASLIVSGLFVTAVSAKEVPIGKHAVQQGLDVGAVYLQPIDMEPAGMMRKAGDSDIHLEADIKATKDNRNGMADGDWVPALDVRYELVKLAGDKIEGEPIRGSMMAMVANDGPHYGDNVKLAGPGKYRLKLVVSPPGPDSHFGRHVDKETGVGEWFKPFDVVQEFTFAGTGKKGTY